MMYTLQHLWDLEMDQLRKEHGKDPDPEMWRWSPLDITEYDRMLNVAYHIVLGFDVFRKRSAPITLIEAGSGIGTKLYLAREKYGIDASGCDINKEYIDRARELFGIETKQCDLREDPPVWSKFDIVYLARPFKDDDEESAWEQSVQDNMMDGAVLIMGFSARKPYGWRCHYRFPFHGVWVKPETAVAAAPVYSAMIQRRPGHDPLVPEPGPVVPLPVERR